MNMVRKHHGGAEISSLINLYQFLTGILLLRSNSFRKQNVISNINFAKKKTEKLKQHDSSKDLE